MVSRAMLQRYFAIDLRALAALRIALGLIVLVDLVDRFALIPFFYSDAGLLPRSLVPLEPFWGPHMWGGSVFYQQGLGALGIVSALSLIVGRNARLATGVCWLTLLSMGWRNPGLGNAGDLILLQLLFWSLFLPMARVWAIDRKRDVGRRGDVVRECARVLSIASAGMLLLMPFVYFFSSLQKLTGSGWIEGSAVWSAVSREAANRSFGLFLRDQLPWFLDAMNYGTLLLEFAAPLLLFVPRRTAGTRGLIFVAFAIFQLGLGLSLRLWIFPFIAVAAMIPVLPSFVFDRLSKAPGGQTITGLPQQPRLRQALSIFLALCLGYGVFSNIQRQTDWMPPKIINRSGRLLGLNQGWAMYADETPWDYRLLIRGTWEVGRTGWIDDWGRTTSWGPVERLRSSYRGVRYLGRQPNVRARPELQGIAMWVCRAWNGAHGPGDQLQEVELSSWIRTLYRDGSPPVVRTQPIARWRCGSGPRPVGDPSSQRR